MSPRKLSEGDRTEILDLYRNTDATSSTLADRYGVSNSTVSRFLKMSLSQEEYDSLIQQKRLARSNSNNSKKKTKNVKSEQSKKESPTTNQQKLEIEEVQENQTTTNPEQEETPSTTEKNPEETVEKPILKTKKTPDNPPDSQPTNIDEDDEDDDNKNLESVNTAQEMFGEEIVEEEDDEDEEDDFEEEETEIKIEVRELIVLPLSQAKFNRNCYLAIDRTAELMTRPLKDFAELGNIPQEEINQKTLPIFENHRVAKRFCDRRGKVIKVPDTRIIEKTVSCLQSKGISRVLMNGKVFKLNE
ncbi:transposase [Cyanobacterium stanieri LEGE 03274]|uniref:Transposase n=1 Tax=Cyanobacterium stanieri LEGE 03274 TaxID=1828756 RepID=A0ABR9V0Y8_9CHRO|nr:transposase [Cyanobacterium stanieri]MBE9221550.1 transposase [Cyanobacterium stanieri LEGE 03274]